MIRLWLAVLVPLTACTSTAQEARQSWQESRQICQKIKEPSERDFCMDMAWRNYRDVLLMNAKETSTTDSDGRHARDEMDDLRRQMDDLKFQMEMNKYESW